MRREHNRSVSKCDQQSLPAGVLDRIMLRIEKERRRRMRVRIAIFGALSVVAAFASLFSSREFYSEFTQSGFSQFFSLIFSDGGTAVSYWQELAYSLAESFPVLAAVAVLASVFAFLFSLRFLTRDLRMAMQKSNFTHAV